MSRQPELAGRPPVFVFDLLRGLAALAVLGAHTREIVFADLPHQPDLSLAGRAFFGITALGHQAVVVFLVLSGLLVTGSALDAIQAGHWSAGAFATARLTRLWIVLLPCLVIGGVEDAVGLAVTHAHGIGGYGLEASAQIVQDRLGLAALAGNMMFLQGFHAPVFGSNVPLWTLAVEAWCYAGLMAAICAWTHRAAPLRLGGIVIIAGLAAVLVLPPAFWAICPIWCFGAALACHERARRDDGADGQGIHTSRPARAFTALSLLAALAGCRVLATRHLALSDYLLGLVVAAFLAAHRDWRPGVRGLSGAARAVAACSYTLYLAHLPLLAVLDAVVLRNARLAWGWAGLSIWSAFVAAAMLQAVALWWLFERRTGTLQAVMTAGPRRWRSLRRPSAQAALT